MWKVSWFYEKVHDLANLGCYTTILYRCNMNLNVDVSVVALLPY